MLKIGSVDINDHRIYPPTRTRREILTDIKDVKKDWQYFHECLGYSAWIMLISLGAQFFVVLSGRPWGFAVISLLFFIGSNIYGSRMSHNMDVAKIGLHNLEVELHLRKVYDDEDPECD